MGSADVVPGVSGGTIAFITGIYQELLDSVSAINLNAFRLLLKGQFSDFWKTINGRQYNTSVQLKYLQTIYKMWSFRNLFCHQ